MHKPIHLSMSYIYPKVGQIMTVFNQGTIFILLAIPRQICIYTLVFNNDKIEKKYRITYIRYIVAPVLYLM